jgi:hypothetical protein
MAEIEIRRNGADADVPAQPDARVTREPLTYHRHSRHSYLLDRVQAENGTNAARVRLERHAAEMEVELAAREARARELLDSRASRSARTRPAPPVRAATSRRRSG